MVSWSFYLQLSHGYICIFLFGVHGHYVFGLRYQYEFVVFALSLIVDLTQLHVMNKRN